MKHQEIAAGYASWNVVDCKDSKSSLRFYKKTSHRKMRRAEKQEIRDIMDERVEA